MSLHFHSKNKMEQHGTKKNQTFYNYYILQNVLFSFFNIRETSEDADSLGDASSQPDTVSIASRTSQNTADSDKVTHTHTLTHTECIQRGVSSCLMTSALLQLAGCVFIWCVSEGVSSGRRLETFTSFLLSGRGMFYLFCLYVSWIREG